MGTYFASHREDIFTAHSMEGPGATIGVKYPGYRKSPVIAQNFGYDRFPPAANDGGTIHPVSDKAPPLQAEDEGSPT
jgi:hypothetical protein